ncbi:PEP-CTERM sorting domain-containing protein [Massilia soli]|uniref:PEP-CTERM sorting domain-containing protein n=1 Tax=Massilia soli TaxID=2792854 RepID=A0ABS7SMV7_9BURK|nr:PEP-CTERM sorting domain-containing protein [Massilia soli]MBZ2207372.1 PEP-CTERM sorting domain-containing protein [Massilia soli]
MTHALSKFALAALLSVSALAQAEVLNFNTPGIVDINNDTNVATYTEQGYAFTGEAATFLPLDGVGASGTGGLFVLPGSMLVLRAETGLFNLLSVDFGLFDIEGFGMLTVTGLLGDSTELMQTIELGELTTFTFENWTGLSQVSFMSDIEFVIDNVEAVADGTAIPEPGSIALMGLALAGLIGSRRRNKVRASRT